MELTPWEKVENRRGVLKRTLFDIGARFGGCQLVWVVLLAKTSGAWVVRVTVNGRELKSLRRVVSPPPEGKRQASSWSDRARARYRLDISMALIRFGGELVAVGNALRHGGRR